MGLHDFTFYNVIKRNSICFRERVAWFEVDDLILQQNGGVGVKPLSYCSNIPTHNSRVIYNHSWNAFSGDCSRLQCN